MEVLQTIWGATLYYATLPIVSVFIIIILLIFIIHAEIKFSHLLRGKNARNLEDTIVTLGKEIKNLQLSRVQIEEYLKQAEPRIQKSVSGVGTVRFNPFKGTGAGGNQSFAVAFLDEHRNGVVISSIYSRERVSVYAKPIENGSSEYELTDEEKGAITKAKSS